MSVIAVNDSCAVASNKGFTLVELLIALLVGSVIMAAVMTSFQSQHKVYLAQDEVVEMQQNVRGAMDMITREIRMAGFDPTGIANASIVTATSSWIGFTQDINENGATADANEAITYGFSTSNDADADGIADTGSAPLGRNTGTATGIGGGGFQSVADNIEAVEFVYLMANGTRTLNPANTADIRGVQVSLLARTRVADQSHIDNKQYLPASATPLAGWIDDPTLPRSAAELAAWGGPFNDHFRRQILTTTVQCRNMGL